MCVCVYRLVLHNKLKHVDIWKYLEAIQTHIVKHQGQLTWEEFGEWKREEIQHYEHKHSFRGDAENRKNILGPLTLQSKQKKELVTI